MKSELTSLDLHFMAREMQALVGSRVDKVYEQKDDLKDFLLIFHKSGSGKLMLRVRLPGLAYLSQYKPDFPETPPGFCMFLRKYLGGAKVLEVRQRGFERILEIAFDAKEKKLTLVCELFSKGNMVLLDAEGKIKGLLESQNWESRTIRGGTKYQYPPEQANTLKMPMAEFEKIVTGTAFDAIVKTFAIELGLGGFYAEELCRKAGIAKDKKRLNLDELQKAYSEMNRMINSAITANFSQGEIMPIGTTLEPEKSFGSFSEAIDETLTQKIESATEKKEAKEKQTKEKKIANVITKQEERLQELENEISENQKKGELIYENYQEVKELLDAINSDRKKMGWEELKKKYARNKLIKSINEKTGTVDVEL